MNQKKKVLLACAMLAATGMTAQKRKTTPPAPQVSHEAGIADSVILKDSNASETVKRLPVLQSFALADLRRQSVIQFNDRRVDLKPILSNPRALTNIADRLQAAPQLIKLRNRTMTVNKVAQGLVVESDLEFSFTNGTCSGGAPNPAIESLGIHCPQRAVPPSKGMSRQDRPTSASHSPAGLVAANRAKYADYYKQQDALIQQHIAKLRAALKDPAKRAQIAAAAGQDKLSQIDALTDDQIKDNIANTGVQHIHETLLVSNSAGTKIPRKVLAMDANPALPSKAAPVVNLDQTTHQPLGPDIYLTGFTFSQPYEWQQPFDFELDPCALGLDALTDGLASVVLSIFGDSGCPIHGSVTPMAGVDVAFGMRFPIKMNMTYDRKVTKKNTTASVTANFAPYQAPPGDFTKAGLDNSLLFNGQEFVAGLYPSAAIAYDLPIAGKGSIPIIDKNTDGLDFTQYLPAPFTGGFFSPPAPGSVLNTAPITITQFDFFANLADIATLQITLNPAIEVGLKSGGLSFELDDKMYQGKPNTPTATMRSTTIQSPATVQLATDVDHSTDFQITNPVYNLGLEITPGLLLNLTVDLAVWSQNWDPFIAIPQLAIEIPSNGVNFTCHKNTICTHEYHQYANQSQVENGSVAGDELKAIKAQGCDGPGSDNVFYCRSNPAWNYCNQHVSATSYKCGLNTLDELNHILGKFHCPKGYCTCENMDFGLCKAQVVTACSTVVAYEGNQIFGYSRCCLPPSPLVNFACISNPAYTAPVPPPLDGLPQKSTSTGPPSQNTAKPTAPNTGTTTAPPTTAGQQQPSHQPTHPPQNNTNTTPNPTTNTTTPPKPGTTAPPKPVTPPPPAVKKTCTPVPGKPCPTQI